MLLSLILLPTIAGIAASFVPRRFMTPTALTGLLLVLLGFVFSKPLFGDASLELPFLFGLSFAFNDYSFIGGISFAALSAGVLLYSQPFISRRQLTVVLLAAASTMGIVLASSFMALFLFWEFLTITASLIIFFDQQGQSRETTRQIGYRFLITHLVAGLLLLVGILMHFTETGSLMIDIPKAGHAFFLLGIGTKAAVVPLHFWLPSTYPRVSPAATVILSIFTTKAGIFVLARLLSGQLLLSYAGAFMALFGIFMALRQTRMRSLLVYHIISQLGYMVASIGIGGELGVNGGLLHMFNHMVYKGLLLMTAASAMYMYGTEDLASQQKKPIWLTLLAIAASLAIVGIPPFNGYVSKGIIKYAVEGQLLAILLQLASIGTALSFCKFVYFGFLRPRVQEVERPNTLPIACKAAMVSMGAVTLWMGVDAQAVQRVTPYAYESVYSPGGVLTSLGLGLLGILVFLAVKTRLDPAKHHSSHTHGLTVPGILETLPKTVLGWTSSLEDQMTTLSTAAFILISVTVVVLVSLILLL